MSIRKVLDVDTLAVAVTLGQTGSVKILTKLLRSAHLDNFLKEN